MLILFVRSLLSPVSGFDVDREEVKELIDDYDLNNNGRIEWKEFLRLCSIRDDDDDDEGGRIRRGRGHRDGRDDRDGRDGDRGGDRGDRGY